MKTLDADLVTRLQRLEGRVRVAAGRMREIDVDPDLAFRGLYITDEQVDRLIDRGVTVDESTDAHLASVPQDGPLRRLVEAFRLEPLDLDLLVIALAPDLDQRFERFYGYLHDDVTRRRASPGLALELLGQSLMDVDARARLSDDSPLVLGGLIRIEEADRPFLTRGLRVPDRVAAHLLGGDAVDTELGPAFVEPDRRTRGIEQPVARVLEAGPHLIYLRETVDAGAAGIGVSAFETVGRRALSLDPRRVEPGALLDFARTALRESRLSGRGLVVGPIDGLDDAVLQTLTEHDEPVVLHGCSVWDPDRCNRPGFIHELELPPQDEQRELWAQELRDDIRADDPVFSPFRMGPRQIRRAVAAGRAHAASEGSSFDAVALAAGARGQNSAGLGRLARRVVPDATWDDIVLPHETDEQLAQVVARVAHRQQVLDDWRLRRGGGRGEGITAMFAGDSGTGKTLAAEVIAHALGLDMYVIDLSTVVDKYVGETEKNLEKIFTEAEGINGILFFDEADALFGKRSEVSDARDRYANVEVAYLLQRMEQFDGLAVLASNLKGNIDEAFARRLSVVVDFPDPDEEHRRRLWVRLLGEAPLDADVEFDFLAAAFPLTGGNIRNIAVTASYLAAADGTAVTMGCLIRGVQIEYRKLGRLCTDPRTHPGVRESVLTKG
jgi:hypothetical protein